MDPRRSPLTTTISRALHGLLSGDVSAADDVERVAHEQIELAVQEAGQLILTHGAVASVLRGYDRGEISQADAQRWASFMRRGYLAGRSTGPIRPIEIEYEETHEDAIVEALGRLDELGDIIDGELRPGEAAELLRELECVD